jgi:hypothetical protein
MRMAEAASAAGGSRTSAADGSRTSAAGGSRASAAGGSRTSAAGGSRASAAGGSRASAAGGTRDSRSIYNEYAPDGLGRGRRVLRTIHAMIERRGRRTQHDQHGTQA